MIRKKNVTPVFMQLFLGSIMYTPKMPLGMPYVSLEGVLIVRPKRER